MNEAQEARQEFEANSFACDLLMPRDLLRKALRNVDLLDAHDVEKIANRFNVPEAMVLWNVGRLQAQRWAQPKGRGR